MYKNVIVNFNHNAFSQLSIDIHEFTDIYNRINFEFSLHLKVMLTKFNSNIKNHSCHLILSLH